MRIDMAVLNLVQMYLRCDFLDMIMPAITWLGNGGILWIICSLLLTAFPRTRKAGIAMAVSLILEVLCCNVVLKPFVARLRPCDVNTAVKLLIPRPDGFSFPSGHTGASFAAAAALAFGEKQMGTAAYIMAALIGFSRIYLYVHYPSDVLAGALLGIMLGWLGNALVKTAEEKWHCRTHVSV